MTTPDSDKPFTSMETADSTEQGGFDSPPPAYSAHTQYGPTSSQPVPKEPPPPYQDTDSAVDTIPIRPSPSRPVTAQPQTYRDPGQSSTAVAAASGNDCQACCDLCECFCECMGVVCCCLSLCGDD